MREVQPEVNQLLRVCEKLYVLEPITKHKSPTLSVGLCDIPGNFLRSHTLARAVPSGLRGLTSVFGMGTGGSLSLWSPRIDVSTKALTNSRIGILNIDGPQKENTAVFTINF